MSNEMDVQRLIAEVRRRPSLWDVRMAEYKDRTNTPHLWNEIAEVMGIDVEHCKRKWKNLRDAYRAEVRRTERRIDRLKALGQYDPQRRATSKWVYFEPMNFINESKRTSYASGVANSTNGRETILPNGEHISASAHHEDAAVYETNFHSFCDIKMETHHTTDDDVDNDEDDEVDDDDEDDDKLFEQFNAVATPQAVRRLSDSIHSAAVAAETQSTPSNVSSSSTATGCKCAKRTDDQVHFLEDLEREEQQLMQSTRKEITRANSVGHVGDADYNFLVSFLPQMKKMSELQNLQFRARMSELLLNTIASPSTPCLSAGGCNAAVTLLAKQQQLQLQQQQQHQQLQALPMPQLTLSRLTDGIVACVPVESPPPTQMVTQDADMSNGSPVVATSAENWS